MRTVHIKNEEKQDVFGWIRVGNQPEKNLLNITVSESLLPVLPKVLARIRNLFDLYCDPDAVYNALSAMNKLKAGLCHKGTRIPGCFDSFEMAVRAVVGQQITVKAARTLTGRLVSAYGTSIETEIPGLTHTFPSPEDILALEGDISGHLGPLGIISSRAHTISKLADAIQSKEIVLDHPVDPEEEMRKLMSIKGIGSWSAQYIAMRTMQWPDAFLDTDAGVKRALPGYTPKELSDISESWRPWRSYATVNLWNTL